MINKIKYLQDDHGKEVGVFVPIDLWKAILKTENLSLLDKTKSGSDKELPAFDLGDDLIFNRDELYNDRLA